MACIVTHATVLTDRPRFHKTGSKARWRWAELIFCKYTPFATRCPGDAPSRYSTIAARQVEASQARDGHLRTLYGEKVSS